MSAIVQRVAERWQALPARMQFALKWLALLSASWVILRPALLITISGDDFLNPFYVFDDYGPSPFGMFRKVSRDLTRAGHFNYVGQNFGAVVYVVWAYLIGWGVRYSLIYAITKFVVLVVAGVVAARLCRTLAALTGRELTVWWSRVVVCAGLFITLQIHVAWSSDPVASFPLSGYLAAAIGLLALDLCIVAMQRDDRRSLIVAAVCLCLAIQYYEINVAIIPALLPVAWILVGDVRRYGRLRTWSIRCGVLVGPAVLMTLVLQRIAATSNRGYTGTDVVVGTGTTTVMVRAVLGSLPGAAWPQARSWLGRSFDLSQGAVVSALIGTAIVVMLAVAASLRAHGVDAVVTGQPEPDRVTAPAPWRSSRTTLLVASVPAIVWLLATAIQATTAKVRAETIAIGYVYNYYAYGSIAVVLIAVLVWPVLPGARRPARALPVLLACAVAFTVVQTVVNHDVRREFGARLAANDALLVVVSEAPAIPERCAAIQSWAALPFWLDYYRADMISGVDAVWQHFHDDPFCPTG